MRSGLFARVDSTCQAAPSCRAVWSWPHARPLRDPDQVQRDGCVPALRARRAIILATCQFRLRRLQRPEALFPRTLEAARDEPVVGIYGAIAALGEACHVARPLDAEPPVLERGLAIHLQLLSSSQRRCDLRRL